MIEGLKPLYASILRPVGRVAARLGIHPNVVTCSGVALFAAAGWYAFAGRWWMSVVFVVIGACMDGLDGLLAREMGRRSRFGAVLDSTCDRLTEILWIGGILGYYLSNGCGRHGLAICLCVAALCGSLLVSYIKARAEGAGIACAGGVLQRPERIIIIAAFMLAGPQRMVWGMGLVSCLALITVIQRVVIVWRNARREL